jgi:sialate O-acetylesterase
MMFSRRLLLGLVFSCFVFSVFAEGFDSLRFAKILSNHMVLQQEKPIKVWGWGKPGSDVAVTITQDAATGAQVEQESSANEKTPQANDEYSITVRYVEKNPPMLNEQTLRAKAGEDGRWSVVFPPAKASFQPTWLIARSGDELAIVRNALIGEVWVCAGQSNMGWSNFNRKGREAGSADFPGLRYIAWEDSWYKPLEEVKKNIGWQECSPETAQRFSAVPYLFGTFLHRYLKVPFGIVNVARGGTLGQTWCLREELESIDDKIIRTVLADYDAETSVWDDPKQLSALMKRWEQDCEKAKAEHAEKKARATAEGKKPPRLRLPKKPGDARSGWSPPAGLFNATVMPIRDLAIRGILYYQGENNNFLRWTRYERTFPKVPVSFRKAFRDETLPFGCISQPGWGEFGIDPEVATIAEGYAIIRDIQRRALKSDPLSDMIATYPSGNSYIHPGEKLPVAEYASLWALAKVYKEPVVHRGNEYTHMKILDNKFYLFFDTDPVVHERWKHIENNAYWQVLPCAREGKAELKGFIIAGKDRRWYPAKARQTKLQNKWCIELTSDLVQEPVAARYGWANWPTGNLVGRERIPIPTFRTDDWPIPEGVNYSNEAKEASSAKLKELREIGSRQALDRKVRQLQIDIPRLEAELFKGDATGSIENKLSRIQGILDEFEADSWLSRQLNGYDPEFATKLKGLRERVEALRKE